jgi:asparagine synthase (glutamine-hydrolysing)
MCGVAGFYDTKKLIKTDHFNVLQKLEEALKHRGPDGYGYWLATDATLGLIHRRLSIQDTSFRARQPFLSSDQSIILSFNGEIYNHPELSKHFKNDGRIYQSESDTETIIHAYQKWGIECLSKLNGMFAFALADQNSGDLFLARDRFGIKPMYFSIQGGVLSFASEIKALWTLPFVEKKIVPELISHYLSLMITPAPLTLFEGIYKLPAGWYAKYSKMGQLTFHQWYDPIQILEQPYHERSEHDAIDELDALISTSVKGMLLSDRSVGAFLSGGLDSSLIVALMSQHQAKTKTFSIGYESKYPDNELSHAKVVAELFGTEHHEMVLDEPHAHSILDEITQQLDEPHADPVCLPFSCVSKLARENNTPVVLVGEGADELFLGYALYQKYHRFGTLGLNKSQSMLPQSVKQLFARCTKPILKANDFYSDILDNWTTDRALFWTGALAFTQMQKTALWKTHQTQPWHDPILEQMYPGMTISFDTHDIIDYHRKKLRAHIPNISLDKEITYLELSHRLPELLLMRADKMSMMHGIETRVPYLDHTIAEFALKLPSSLKIGWNSTKYILKKVAERYLPRSIVYRTKQGFSVPLLQWLSQGEYLSSRTTSMMQSSGKLLSNINTQQLSTYKTGNASKAVQQWSLLQLSMFEKTL